MNTETFQRIPDAALSGQSHADQQAVIAKLIEACERAAQGDLESRIVGLEPDSEFSRLAHAINHLLDMSDAFAREAAAAMENCSHDRFHRPILLRGMHGSYRQSAITINQAGRKMRESNEQIVFVGRLAGETAASVATVAAACEELNSTSSEISKQAKESERISQDAVQIVKQAEHAVQQLGAATKKVDSIVTLINKIAGQTNLLALNATIEAARAGEVGRGFAVVATEVKDLSRNTAKATEEISQQVDRMHATVNGVTDFISSINNVVTRVTEGAGAISHAVAEQVTATADIARNLSAVSKNSQLVSERIGIFNGS
jgi:methyl-accepting chemotaxis protein